MIRDALRHRFAWLIALWFLGMALPVAAATTRSSEPAATITIDIKVELNGRHPNGMGSWDGRRPYWLPVETSLQSPADIDVAVIQDGSVLFGANDAGTLCPERDVCWIRDLDIDPSQPFAVMVLDYDGVLAEATRAAGRQAGAAARVVRDLEADIGAGLAEFDETAKTAIGRMAALAVGQLVTGLKAASDGVKAFDVPRYQLIDAVVFRPNHADGSDHPLRAPDILALEADMRALSERIVMPTFIWDGHARLEGEQPSWNVWEGLNALEGLPLSYSILTMTEVYE